MKLHKYTEAQLREAVTASRSKRQTLLKLGIKAAGGNYRTLDKAIAHFSIDTSHFKGQGWTQGSKPGPKRDTSVYLNNQLPIKSHKLKTRLIREGIFKHKCYGCGKSRWQGHPIPIELDHINGDHKDNSLCNLRILCPNCHALTPTYRGKNKRTRS